MKISKQFIAIASMLLLVTLIFTECNRNDENSFIGDKEAVELANKMFNAIGSMEKWCELKSIYIKAQHWEENIDGPYSSEIWRNLDEFLIKIEQKHETFHVTANVNSSSGKITYLDQRDTFRILSPQQLIEWKHEHNYNVYVVLHRLACDPDKYEVVKESEDILKFFESGSLYCKVQLDKMFRPFMYYTPDVNGNLSGSVFTEWGEDDGLVHSAGGYPLDSSFIYRTEVWTPGYSPFK